ncbi:MAG: hypothetical protein JW731_13855 [Bacteroidales bacterium]|nr:hypothetical protein [Bacteroidales bacterium]
MKKFGLILTTFALLFVMGFSSNAQTPAKDDGKEIVKSDNIEMYYFHYERRCATCLAVESESEKILGELYPEKVKSGEITFLSVNLEDESNQPLAEKLRVDGQTLLVVKGDKQDNLTNKAFMYVNTNRDKFKKAIQESIENM